ADAGALRLDGDPPVGGENKPGDRGARGYSLVRVRRGDCGAHLGRIIRPSGCARAARGRAGHVGGISPATGVRDSAAGGRSGGGDGTDRRILMLAGAVRSFGKIALCGTTTR